MSYILSILIPTLPARKAKFEALINNLVWQQTYLQLDHPSLGFVEILSDDSVSFLEGGLSIGSKRQLLLDRAQGKYIAFLDDDDCISPNYLELLVRHCNTQASIHSDLTVLPEYPDVVTFNTLIKNDHYWATINMSIRNRVNEEVGPIGITLRTPWHICPIKAEIAKKYSFEAINHNEDWKWMEQVINDLKTELHINSILTQYNHSEKLSEADKIIKSQFENRNVGNYSK